MAIRLKEFAFRGISIVRPVFIETGTYQGETLNFAYEAGFGELHSIEVYEPNYLAAQRRFAGVDKVHLHLGTSPRVLPSVMNPALATTFWLDAHFQGSSASEQDPEFGECPLLAELDAIRAVRWDTSPVILIDDAYMFDDRIFSGFDRRQWPTMLEISQHLPAGYEMVEHNEILYCVPREQ